MSGFINQGGGSGGGGIAREEITLTGNIVYDPDAEGGTKRDVYFYQDSTGGHTVDLSAIQFAPAQVSFISEEPDALSRMTITKGDDEVWTCDFGIEWGY